jgi:hypothetical protein
MVGSEVGAGMPLVRRGMRRWASSRPVAPRVFQFFAKDPWGCVSHLCGAVASFGGVEPHFLGVAIDGLADHFEVGGARPRLDTRLCPTAVGSDSDARSKPVWVHSARTRTSLVN